MERGKMTGAGDGTSETELKKFKNLLGTFTPTLTTEQLIFHRGLIISFLPVPA